MKQFNDGKNLKGLRNRTYFETFTEDSVIRSEGAWRMRIWNLGDTRATLRDGAGNLIELQIITGFGADIGLFEKDCFIIGGHQEILMDDEFILAFRQPVGVRLSVTVIFERIIEKKDENVYPQEEYFQGGGQ